MKMIKSLEDSGVLIDGVTETVKHEIKKTEGVFLGALLAPFAASLVQPVISSVVKGMSGTGVRRAERGYMNQKFLVSLHSLRADSLKKHIGFHYLLIEIQLYTLNLLE